MKENTFSQGVGRAPFTRELPLFEHRAVHLDLKGLPPTPERLLLFLDLCAAARYNAVLVEWEDMFPWTVDERFRCETAYTSAEVDAFVKKAARLGIELIPLVQCLGHMETPLRLPDYAALREVPGNADVLNPLAPGARDLVLRMVEDVLERMPAATYFHLGGDEAWTYGTHPDTKAFIEQHGKGALYMQHVEPILDRLLARGIRPILWHDMMTGWEDAALIALKEKADLCVWGYGQDPRVTRHHSSVVHIRRFHQLGLSMWAGSAYKGADGVDSDLPLLPNRLANMKAWAEVGEEFRMKGMVMTAWSRYSTDQVQTEPMDGALDLFFLGGLLAHDGEIPKDRDAAVRTLLRQTGEEARFTACREVLAKISVERTAGWANARMLREYLITAEEDPKRACSGHAGKHLEHLVRHADTLEQLRPAFLAAFTSLTPEIWLQRYFNERYLSLRAESDELARRMNEQPFPFSPG
ncbi:MAG: family 20 glycosylhydrolase [Kiritimatiellia bacterium]|nr:family 20 glycosylhydrolase [Kiritimatiellia bacterium]